MKDTLQYPYKEEYVLCLFAFFFFFFFGGGGGVKQIVEKRNIKRIPRTYPEYTKSSLNTNIPLQHSLDDT